MQLRNLMQPEMEPDRLKEHVFATYLSLRYGVAIITLIFPVAVYLGGSLKREGLLGSLSAYYWGSGAEINTGRTVFVGGLFAIAVFMYLYKGFTRPENFALNAAAVFAVLVALVPMKNEQILWDPSYFHGTFAILLFICLTYVVWFRAGDTLTLLPPENPPAPATKRYSRAWYQRRYKVIGWVMLASPITASILNVWLGLLDASTQKNRYIFFIESAGVWAFAWYWFAKSSELKRSLATRRALSGQIHVKSGQAQER